MRIFGGKFKGRNFYMPKDIRPTQGMTREAIFNIVGQDMTGVAFLDLFAGSGAVGLEALSRGAKHVTFVEHDSTCQRVLEENLGLFGIKQTPGEAQGCEIMGLDAFAAIKYLGRKGRKFDIVFFDPPYGLDLVKKTLKTLMAYDILHPNCFIIVEHSKHDTLPEIEERFSLIRQRKYGKAYLAVYQGCRGI
jgi:16S rRNA (guanine966-N2)-methyltransferase